MMPSDIPIATYRLQLSKEFGFDHAARLVPYLKSLGISHLYASPFLKARAGSKHGYDVVDHAALNPEFGGDAAFERLSDALRHHSMGLILDFVPNHMGIGYADNAWWLDVLEWGRQSPHAHAFDISWDLLPFRHGSGVLLPVLGEPYGEALHKGDIALSYDPREGSFSAWYFVHRFPINPQRYGDMLRIIVAAAAGGDEPAGRALLELAAAYSHPRSPSYAQAPELKRKLMEVEGAPSLIERGLKAYRGDHDEGRHALHRLLERQHYRLAYWRVAVSGINYRRFFDINDLAGLRVEDVPTFRAIHRLVARLIGEGRLQGLRLDHVDGLLDPMQYTRRLGQLGRQATRSSKRRLYVVVEKILGSNEALPRFPDIDGTTGYEWLNIISRLLLDERGLPALDRAWQRAAGERRSFGEILEQAKRRVIETILSSEFTVLAQLLARIAAGHYSTRDYTPDRLRAALELYVVAFPIYRTYVTSAGASDTDRSVIGPAIAAARARWPGSDPEIFEFLRDVVTLDLLKDSRSYSRPRVRDFAFRLQQFTGPLMAKSLEDTAFYRYHRLIALNEVGGHPDVGGITVSDFHERMRRRADLFPHGMTATATHDTKRGEDTRARILALAEVAEEWADEVVRWQEMNRRLVRDAPSPTHEYMIYQAIVGAWPLQGVDQTFVERMQAFAVKAVREGKEQSSWINVNESYEQSLQEFIAKILDRHRASDFLQTFDAFARRMALIGALNSLSQLVLKATMPGTPDFYQGTEFWDLSLVDPDNRRPVDFESRLDASRQKFLSWQSLADQWTDGRIKLALTQRLLSLRSELSPMFQDGAYQELEVTGQDRDNVIVFVRAHGQRRVVVAVGRHYATATNGGRQWPRQGWNAQIKLKDLPAKGYCDVLRDCQPVTGPALDLARLFNGMPIILLRTA